MKLINRCYSIHRDVISYQVGTHTDSVLSAWERNIPLPIFPGLSFLEQLATYRSVIIQFQRENDWSWIWFNNHLTIFPCSQAVSNPYEVAHMQYNIIVLTKKPQSWNHCIIKPPHAVSSGLPLENSICILVFILWAAISRNFKWSFRKLMFISRF